MSQAGSADEKRARRPGRLQARRAALLVVAAAAGPGAGCSGTLPGAPSPSTEVHVPGVRVTLEERFYPVEGLSARALNRALAAAGPRSGGRRAHALTEWELEWSYQPARRASTCVISRPEVRLEIVTTLPRWVNADAAPERLLADWALFLARLRDHEARHQYLALASGRELLATLSGLVAASCELLEAEAERAAAILAARYEAEHAQLDRPTRSGLGLSR